MGLIQDITPAGKKPAHHSPQNIAIIGGRRFHRDTVIPPLTMEPVKQLRRPSFQLPTANSHSRMFPNISLTPVTKPEQHKINPPAITQKSKIRTKILKFFKYLLLVTIVLFAGASSTIGQVIIGIYFIIAVIFRIGSRVSFILALVLLVFIPLLGLIGQSGISDNAAIYAFELLVIGTVQSIIEIWKEK